MIKKYHAVRKAVFYDGSEESKKAIAELFPNIPQPLGDHILGNYIRQNSKGEPAFAQKEWFEHKFAFLPDEWHDVNERKPEDKFVLAIVNSCPHFCSFHTELGEGHEYYVLEAKNIIVKPTYWRSLESLNIPQRPK